MCIDLLEYTLYEIRLASGEILFKVGRVLRKFTL